MNTTTPFRIWLHRVSHNVEAAHPLLKSGFLNVGYSDFCDVEFLEKTRAGDRAYHEKAFIEKWPQNPRPRTRHNLWKIIAEMRVREWVLVPSWGAEIRDFRS